MTTNKKPGGNQRQLHPGRASLLSCQLRGSQQVAAVRDLGGRLRGRTWQRLLKRMVFHSRNGVPFQESSVFVPFSPPSHLQPLPRLGFGLSPPSVSPVPTPCERLVLGALVCPSPLGCSPTAKPSWPDFELLAPFTHPCPPSLGDSPTPCPSRPTAKPRRTYSCALPGFPTPLH